MGDGSTDGAKVKRTLYLLTVVLTGYLLSACVAQPQGIAKVYAGEEANRFFRDRLPKDFEGEDLRFDQPLKFMTFALPSFPHEALRLGVQGVVLVEASVDEQGRVTEVEVLRSPHITLSDEIQQTLRRWRFEPATRAGKPVRFRFRQEYAFQIN